jgi:hypothetical protein
LKKDYEICVSKKQDNEIGFGDPIADDDSGTTINILISKEKDLKTKMYPSKMNIYKKYID